MTFGTLFRQQFHIIYIYIYIYTIMLVLLLIYNIYIYIYQYNYISYIYIYIYIDIDIAFYRHSIGTLSLFFIKIHLLIKATQIQRNTFFTFLQDFLFI